MSTSSPAQSTVGNINQRCYTYKTPKDESYGPCADFYSSLVFLPYTWSYLKNSRATNGSYPKNLIVHVVLVGSLNNLYSKTRGRTQRLSHPDATPNFQT